MGFIPLEPCTTIEAVRADARSAKHWAYVLRGNGESLDICPTCSQESFPPANEAAPNETECPECEGGNIVGASGCWNCDGTGLVIKDP